jgi:GT2 family glycosyltransferase
MPKKPKVSIILVYYQNIKDLFECLYSIFKNHSKQAVEVIVVNNSTEKEFERKIAVGFPIVKIVNSKVNIGFGAGQNLGVKKAIGEYLFILNPDTKLFDKTIDRLTRYLDCHPNVGIVAPTLVDKNNKKYSIQGTSELNPLTGIVCLSFMNKLFPNNPISRKYWLKDVDRKEIREVDFVQGSAFMIRKRLFNLLGGFDEQFFLYFEDNDLCKRVVDKGKKIAILPKANVMHNWGGSTPKTKKIRKIFNQSRYKYFMKHYGIVWALTVEFFARLSKEKAITLFFLLFLILFLFKL